MHDGSSYEIPGFPRHRRLGATIFRVSSSETLGVY
jgi:hypothetical protein